LSHRSRIRMYRRKTCATWCTHPPRPGLTATALPDRYLQVLRLTVPPDTQVHLGSRKSRSNAVQCITPVNDRNPVYRGDDVTSAEAASRCRTIHLDRGNE